MTQVWLHIMGIGDDGPAGLSSVSRSILETADVVIGGKRHHALCPDLGAKRISWPTPFDTLIDEIRRHKGKQVVVLVTGDPLWYSAGAKIAAAFEACETLIHPHLSAFQLAAARMGWGMGDIHALTVHGRPVERIIPHIYPGAKLILLTQGAETPMQVAKILTSRGYGPSRLTALAHMGGAQEMRHDGTAQDWAQDVPAFHSLAVEVVAGPDARILPNIPGLPDEVFAHDGTMTKRDVRAMTLARLMPMPNALLWDVGCGCGSVAIEWMRAGGRAIGVEARADRHALAAQNALSLGAPGLDLIHGQVPDALRSLPQPDAVFVGGGMSRAVFDLAWDALPQGGRFVANGVTLETESLLTELHKTHGGDLIRMSIDHAAPLGPHRSWRAAMPVTQWSVVK